MLLPDKTLHSAPVPFHLFAFFLLRACMPTANTWVVNERNRGGDVDTRDCRPVVDDDDDDWWQSTLHARAPAE